MNSTKTKVMPVEYQENMKPVSMMSKIVTFLIFVRFIPVDKSMKKEIKFKMCSWLTFTSFVIWWGLNVLFLVLRTISSEYITKIIVAHLNKINVIDIISSYGFSWGGYAFIPFCPLILAHALPLFQNW